jgi:hypothetical protein
MEARGPHRRLRSLALAVALGVTGDGDIKSKTKWNGDQLVIEEKYQDGPKVTRTFTVSSDLRQLMIHIKVEGTGTRGEMTTNHVFDRQMP